MAQSYHHFRKTSTPLSEGVPENWPKFGDGSDGMNCGSFHLPKFSHLMSLDVTEVEVFMPQIFCHLPKVTQDVLLAPGELRTLVQGTFLAPHGQ